MACLRGDERGARNAAKATPEIVYHASKRALTL